MKNLSGGQKVKCVIGASMWFCPHIVVLDEPTNYLDRDSLGALSRAIKEFQGGVLMISHNAEFFGDIAPEVWEVPGDQKVHVSGAEWMEAVKAKELAEAKAKKKSIPKQDDDKFDALGNKIETEAGGCSTRRITYQSRAIDATHRLLTQAMPSRVLIATRRTHSLCRTTRPRTTRPPPPRSPASSRAAGSSPWTTRTTRSTRRSPGTRS